MPMRLLDLQLIINAACPMLKVAQCKTFMQKLNFCQPTTDDEYVPAALTLETQTSSCRRGRRQSANRPEAICSFLSKVINLLRLAFIITTSKKLRFWLVRLHIAHSNDEDESESNRFDDESNRSAADPKTGNYWPEAWKNPFQPIISFFAYSELLGILRLTLPAK